MSGQPVLGTDNNYLVQRTAPNTWAQVYSTLHNGATHSFEGGIFNSLINSRQKPGQVWCYDNNTDEYTSADAGATWTWHDYATHPKPDPSFPRGGPIIMAAPDGTLLAIVQSNKVASGTANHYYLIKSTDGGATWTQVADLGLFTSPADPRFTWAGDGYVWWQTNDAGGTQTLHRVDYAGTNDTTWTYSFSALTGQLNMSGYDGAKRLYVFDPTRTVRLFSSIDVTNPASPSFSTPAWPFAITRRMQWMTPVTNQIAVAHVVINNFTQGGIWRTTDAGATWTQVVSDTTHLGQGATTGNDAAGNPTIVVDPTDNQTIWCASAIPHTWYSTDQGATWTEEDYNGPSLGAGEEWTTLCVAGAAAAAARTYGFVTQMF